VTTSFSAPWSEFSQDPRRPESAGLRASDRDREVALQVLAEAFADGRLDRAEYDERADAVAKAKTLGELPRVIADLVPATPALRQETGLAAMGAADLRARAVQDYRRDLRTALSQVVVVGALTTGIWALTGAGYFWPGFVILAVSINVLRLLLTRNDHIEDRVRELEKKQRKEIEGGRSREPGTSEDD
jgi:hypothetical protein